MTKHEFMARLASELHKRNVADAADVTQEYEQHFAFKLADGYSEEEIKKLNWLRSLKVLTRQRKSAAAKLLPLSACASPICLPGCSSCCWPASDL